MNTPKREDYSLPELDSSLPDNDVLGALGLVLFLTTLVCLYFYWRLS